MENLSEPIVCEPVLVSEPAPRPSMNDWKLFDEGSRMTAEQLHFPELKKFVDDEVFGKWYWEHLCMCIGSVTGGDLTFKDYDMIRFGVNLHAVYQSRGVPRMVFTPHADCGADCYYCTLYRDSLLTEFGFELSKFVGYDGVDGSVFNDYAKDGYDGYGYDYVNEGDDDDDSDDGDEVGDDDGYDFHNGW